MPFQFIYFEEKIPGGKTIIKGWRVSVEFIMEWKIAKAFGRGTVESFYNQYSYFQKVLLRKQFYMLPGLLKMKYE